MKTFIHTLLCSCLCVALFSCAEDRTYEYEEKTQHNHWMLDVMRDKYLWAEALADYEPSWKDFFSQPSAFMSTLAKKGDNDKWSYVEVDTIEADSHQRGYYSHLDSYGFDFVLINDPTGMTTRSVARVLTVYPDSPAERVGLRRGDFICSFDGYKLSTKNISKLTKGEERKLELRTLAIEPIEGSLVWTDTVTLTLPQSEKVEDVAFPAHVVVGVEGVKVGYLMCTRLVEGNAEADSADKSYRNALDQIMSSMKNSQVEELVLDLRLCNYGDLSMVQRLGSSIVPRSLLGQTMLQTQWNEKNKASNIIVPYDASAVNLSLDRILVLTSAHTCGAAEWLIQALRHDMGEENVITIGAATPGQNVMTAPLSTMYHVTPYPSVAFVCLSDGTHDYGSILPDEPVDELSFLDLGQYGSVDEPLFRAAIERIFYVEEEVEDGDADDAEGDDADDAEEDDADDAEGDEAGDAE